MKIADAIIKNGLDYSYPVQDTMVKSISNEEVNAFFETKDEYTMKEHYFFGLYSKGVLKGAAILGKPSEWCRNDNRTVEILKWSICEDFFEKGSLFFVEGLSSMSGSLGYKKIIVKTYAFLINEYLAKAGFFPVGKTLKIMNGVEQYFKVWEKRI